MRKHTSTETSQTNSIGIALDTESQADPARWPDMAFDRDLLLAKGPAADVGGRDGRGQIMWRVERVLVEVTCA